MAKKRGWKKAQGSFWKKSKGTSFGLLVAAWLPVWLTHAHTQSTVPVGCCCWLRHGLVLLPQLIPRSQWIAISLIPPEPHTGGSGTNTLLLEHFDSAFSNAREKMKEMPSATIERWNALMKEQHGKVKREQQMLTDKNKKNKKRNKRMKGKAGKLYKEGRL